MEQDLENHEKDRITISVSNARLQKVASKDDARRAMTGVHFDAKAKLAVATDGRMLAIQPASEGSPFGETIRLGALKKVEGESYPFTSSGMKGSYGEMFFEDSMAGAAWRIVERFPDYRSVVDHLPRKKEVVIGINADYLKALADALSDGKMRAIVLSIDAEDPNAPIVVGGDLGCGVLMPLNLDDDIGSPVTMLQSLVNGEG